MIISNKHLAACDYAKMCGNTQSFVQLNLQLKFTLKFTVCDRFESWNGNIHKMVNVA